VAVLVVDALEKTDIEEDRQNGAGPPALLHGTARG